MKQYLMKYAYCAYLGAVLGICNVNVFNWQWWVIVIPTIALVEMYKKAE